jgi:AbiU2
LSAKPNKPKKEQINKLQAHAEHLLDGFITLRERYAILRPMLHNKDVVENKGSKKQYAGFIIIRNTLFLSCCQLIANLCFDNDKDNKCPSINQIVQRLENEVLRKQLREIYALPSIIASDETDPQIIEMWKRIEAEDQIKHRNEFDGFYDELLVLWSQLKTSKSAQSLETIRNKVAAHTDINYINGEYKLFDISFLDLKWDDILDTISAMQKIIDIINIIVRNISYSWESLDEILSKTANDYWQISR